MFRRILPVAILAVAAMASGSAHADVTPGVISAFHGELVVTKDELPEGKSDRDTIAKIHAAREKEVTGEPKGDVTAWTFHYTAFLTRTGASSLKLWFLQGKQLSADKNLDGIDPKSKVLTGDISIDEDEGVTKGKTYTVELTTGKSVVAKTTLTFK